MIKTHLVYTVDSLCAAFWDLYPGTDYTSSAYFEELKPGEVLGQQEGKHRLKTYNMLKILRSYGTTINCPKNWFVAVINYLQRPIENSKCRLRPAVRRLLNKIILTTFCQHQMWLQYKRHVDYDRALRENSDNAVIQALRSIRDP